MDGDTPIIVSLITALAIFDICCLVFYNSAVQGTWCSETEQKGQDND